MSPSLEGGQVPDFTIRPGALPGSRGLILREKRKYGPKDGTSDAVDGRGIKGLDKELSGTIFFFFSYEKSRLWRGSDRRKTENKCFRDATRTVPFFSLFYGMK